MVKTGNKPRNRRRGLATGKWLRNTKSDVKLVSEKVLEPNVVRHAKMP